MINLKTTRELRYMRDAGKISQEALLKAGEAVRPGVSTLELDKIVRRTIEKAGAVPSFLGYGGFPASPCWFSISHRRGGRLCPPAENPAFLEEFSANSQHFNGPMWASAPTNEI